MKINNSIPAAHFHPRKPIGYSLPTNANFCSIFIIICQVRDATSGIKHFCGMVDSTNVILKISTQWIFIEKRNSGCVPPVVTMNTEIHFKWFTFFIAFIEVTPINWIIGNMKHINSFTGPRVCPLI